MPRKQDWTPRAGAPATPEMQAFVHKSNELVNVMNSMLVLWEKLDAKPGNSAFIDMLAQDYPFPLSFDEMFTQVMSWNYKMRAFLKTRREL